MISPSTGVPFHFKRGKAQTWPRLLSLALTACLAMLGAPAKSQSKSTGKVSTTAQKKSSSPSKTKKKRTRSSRSRGQAAPTVDRIREIQTALGRAGHYSGEPSGKWDSETTTAMKNFQEAQRLRPSGKLDAVTLQRLGLGSPVTGVAPPRPAATSSPSSES